MPFKAVWEKGGIYWKFEGDVSAEEIEKANEEFYNDERSEKAKYQIIDASEVKSVEWDESQIKKMAAYDLGQTYVVKDVKVAYIADEADIISKLEKYIDISRKLNSRWQFKGFKNLSEARTWAEK